MSINAEVCSNNGCINANVNDPDPHAVGVKSLHHPKIVIIRSFVQDFLLDLLRVLINILRHLALVALLGGSERSESCTKLCLRLVLLLLLIYAIVLLCDVDLWAGQELAEVDRADNRQQRSVRHLGTWNIQVLSFVVKQEYADQWHND